MAAFGGFLKSRVRHVVSAALVILGVVTIVPAFAGTAGAHHAEVTAEVNCDAVISYTATAWSGYNDDPYTTANEYDLSRTNTSVRVRVQILAGSGIPPADQFGAFNSGNGYSFSGTFQWPTGATSIRLQVEALVLWANGVGGGGPRTVDLRLPTNCQTTTSVGQTTTSVGQTTTSVGQTTTSVGQTTTSVGQTTTSVGQTTTSVGQTTTSVGQTTTSVGQTTTSVGQTTTSVGQTTTSVGQTTTTVGCGEGTTTSVGGGCGTTTTVGGGTTTTVGGGTTTTLGGGGGTTTTVGSGGGTTTTVRTGGTLPRSGGSGESKPMMSMAFGFGCIGSALLLSRPRLPRRWRVAAN